MIKFVNKKEIKNHNQTFRSKLAISRARIIINSESARSLVEEKASTLDLDRLIRLDNK
jgi:hypothetical protein